MDDGLKEFTAERLAALGLNAFEAARKGGLERTFVRDILIGRKRTVLGGNIPRLADALDTSSEEIARAMSRRAGTLPANRPRPAGEVVPAAIVLPDAAAVPRDLPVYGTASGAIVEVQGRGGRFEGFALDRSRAVDHVRRLPALAGAPDAYAVYIAGDSMAPMHAAGELRVVHPGRPVRPGDTVLIVVRPGEGLAEQAFIKIFRGRTAQSVIAEQLSPKAVMAFKAGTVAAVHKVLTMAELLEA